MQQQEEEGMEYDLNILEERERQVRDIEVSKYTIFNPHRVLPLEVTPSSHRKYLALVCVCVCGHFFFYVSRSRCKIV